MIQYNARLLVELLEQSTGYPIHGGEDEAKARALLGSIASELGGNAAQVERMTLSGATVYVLALLLTHY